MTAYPLRLRRRHFLSGFAAVGAALLLPTRNARARARIGVVVDIAGNVTGEEKVGASRPLTKDMPVHANETIKTAAKSGIGVRLENGPALRLGAQGSVKVQSLTAEGGGRIALGAGPLLIDRATPRRSAASKNDSGALVVETPFCTITLDDDSRVFAGPSKGVFGVFVDRGSVTIVARGKRFQLNQGEGTDVRRAGGSATPPARWKAPRIRLAFDSVQAPLSEEKQEKK